MCYNKNGDRMKNILKGILTCLVILVIIIQIKKVFLKQYQISYKIHNYKIIEKYKKEKDHFYHITITDKKNTFIYDISHNFNKKKKIIKDIKTFKNNNLVCIIPIYKKNMINKLYCNNEKEQVSNDYLIKSNNKDFMKIKKKIKSYKVSFPKNSDDKKKYKKIEVYQDNISEKNIYYLWDYKGIYILDNNQLSYQKLLSKDLYDNIMATTTNNYYVLFDNTSVKGINKIYYYNYKNNKVKKFKIKTILSKDTYINGNVKDLIYLTDKKNKKQYTLDIKKEKLTRIDQDETTYILYKNGKRKLLSKSDFFMQEQLFNEKENYYLEDNKIYKRETANHKILLLELDNIKEWNVEEDEILMLQEDILYSYSEENGLRKILQSNELKYNYKNIYKIGKR